MEEKDQLTREIADLAEKELASGWGYGLTSAHVRNVIAELGVLASRLQELEGN